MKISCPRCGISRKSIQNYGRYYRTSDAQWVRRYRCKSCRKNFSSATFTPCYNQNKRRLNPVIQKLLASCMSQRRIALVLGISRVTVARKLRFLAAQARLRHEDWLSEQKIDFFQFDDLETFEHSKCKPVTVTLCVNENRKILTFGVARIPAKGHLAKIASRKYGYRKNESFRMRDELFQNLKPLVRKQAIICSDEHPHYQAVIKRHFPMCEYKRFRSIRGCITGQGELKKTAFDPLFRINHTFAMLRANLNRLVRRTWCTTKDIAALEDHIAIYVDFHNQRLTKNA